MVALRKFRSAKAERARAVGSRTGGSRTGGRSARVVSEVLAATLEAFTEHGYAGLSIENVALRAHVNKTTIYRRWPSKAELLGAALSSLRSDEAEPPDTGSLRQDLLILLERFAQRIQTPRHRAIMHAVLLETGDPDMQALMRRLREERPAIPFVIFERARARGELPPNYDAKLMAAALLGPLHIRAHWKHEPIDDAFVRGLIDLVVSGAAAGGTRGKKS